MDGERIPFPTGEQLLSWLDIAKNAGIVALHFLGDQVRSPAAPIMSNHFHVHLHNHKAPSEAIEAYYTRALEQHSELPEHE